MPLELPSLEAPQTSHATVLGSWLPFSPPNPLTQPYTLLPPVCAALCVLFGAVCCVLRRRPPSWCGLSACVSGWPLQHAHPLLTSVPQAVARAFPIWGEECVEVGGWVGGGWVGGWGRRWVGGWVGRRWVGVGG